MSYVRAVGVGGDDGGVRACAVQDGWPGVAADEGEQWGGASASAFAGGD